MHDGPIENAHIVTGGMGRKADAALIIPLCHSHHLALHDFGVEAFEAVYRISLEREAQQIQALWLAHIGRADAREETE
jgi:hypothetical protein